MSAGCRDCGAPKPSPRHTYCAEHSATRRRATRSGTKNDSTTARGYDAAHRAERERWRPAVERGEVDCHAAICLEPERRIAADATWHLGHTPDRTSWTGPEHERCNTSEGATRGNRERTHQTRVTTLQW